MCKGERDICQLCRRDITDESRSTADDHRPSGGENGFDHSLSNERSKPDICPDCTSDGYRELHATFETLARPIKENIANLQAEADKNRDLLNQVSQMYSRRVDESRAIIGSPDTDWSMKLNAHSVADAARKHMQPLLEHHSTCATRLAEDLEREEKLLLLIRRHHLAELDFFRGEHSIGVTPHPAHTSSPTPKPSP